MRVHGESGIPEGSYEFWQTLFEAVKGCGRTVEIDMHAKGVDEKMVGIAAATRHAGEIKRQIFCRAPELLDISKLTFAHWKFPSPAKKARARSA